MEETKNGEQLENITESKNGATMQKEEVAQNVEESGSLNKFKNFSELEKAYVNLEKEFTKKCQALNKLKAGDNEAPTSTSGNDASPQGFADYEKINKFFEDNPNAKQFADEISTVIKSDKVLAESPNSLDLAFEKVKANHFKTKDEMLVDEDFVENYVLKNDKIKEKILEQYLSGIMSSKTLPIMASPVGANMMITPPSKPKTIKEAGEYMMSLVNNK